MSFQFGTNWPGFMERAGNIAGPLLGYEVLTAFFLEATFLGIMLFGRNKVSATHAPAGHPDGGGRHHLVGLLDPQPELVDADPAGPRDDRRPAARANWLAVIFNPSFPYRLAHKLLASTLTASFLMAGLSAWQLLRGTANGGTRHALRAGVVSAAIAIPVQIFVGDLHGLNTLEHQPAKIAAIEGVWHTEKSVPLTLFGWPNEREQRTDYAIRRAQARQPDPGARRAGRTQGPGRNSRRTSAGGAGVLELPCDGGHGHRHAGRVVVVRLDLVGAAVRRARRLPRSRVGSCGCWRP